MALHGPQSAQSVQGKHDAHSAPGPPSSQSPSLAAKQLFKQGEPTGGGGGGDGLAGDDMESHGPQSAQSVQRRQIEY